MRDERPRFGHRTGRTILAQAIGVALFLPTIALFLALPGCRLAGGSDPSDCSVRLIDAIPDAQDMRVAVNGQKVFHGCAFRSGTGFQDIPPGRYQVYAAVQGESADLHLPIVAVDAKPDHRYTALAMGMDGGSPKAHVAVYEDTIDPNPIPRDQAIVRVVSAVPDAGSVDVLVNGIVAFKSLRFGDRSEPLPLAALPYEWSVKEAGSYVTPLAGPITLKLHGGRSYLIVLMGKASDQTLGIEQFEDR